MYHALIPEQAAKSLKTEYRVRLLVVFLFFMSSAAVIGAVCLFPAYLLSGLNERQDEGQAQALVRATASSTSSTEGDLTAAGALVSSISSFVSAPLSNVILHISAIRSRGVSVSSFDVQYAGNKASTVTLSGIALTRGSLVAFRDALEADKSFSGVMVPLSDLAPASNIAFSIKLSAATQ